MGAGKNKERGCGGAALPLFMKGKETKKQFKTRGLKDKGKSAFFCVRSFLYFYLVRFSRLLIWNTGKLAFVSIVGGFAYTLVGIFSGREPARFGAGQVFLAAGVVLLYARYRLRTKAARSYRVLCVLKDGRIVQKPMRNRFTGAKWWQSRKEGLEKFEIAFQLDMQNIIKDFHSSGMDLSMRAHFLVTREVIRLVSGTALENGDLSPLKEGGTKTFHGPYYDICICYLKQRRDAHLVWLATNLFPGVPYITRCYKKEPYYYLYLEPNPVESVLTPNLGFQIKKTRKRKGEKAGHGASAKTV
jgi:hypothetical protein